jgi:hypothetical protein
MPTDTSALLGPLSLSDWDHLAKALGIFGAGAFFAYKAVTGYHLANLSLATSHRRQPISDSSGHDHLVIDIALSKGERGTIKLRGGSVRVTPLTDVKFEEAAQSSSLPVHNNTDYFELIGLERLSFERTPIPGNEGKRYVLGMGWPGPPRKYFKIRWQNRSETAPYINITPGEEMALTAYGKINHQTGYQVDVVIVGRRSWSWKVGQWRASFVSLPEEKTTPSDISRLTLLAKLEP